jgi:hypothetical protein
MHKYLLNTHGRLWLGFGLGPRSLDASPWFDL